jgi:hypothetical protein
VAIGANWKEIWKPVWKPVWTSVAPSATVSLAATGESGTLSASAYVPAQASLSATGESGTLSAVAYVPAIVSLAATGDSGILLATASIPSSTFVGFGDLSFDTPKRKKKKPLPPEKTVREELEELFAEPKSEPTPDKPISERAEPPSSTPLEVEIEAQTVITVAPSPSSALSLKPLESEVRALREEIGALREELRDQHRQSRRLARRWAQQQLLVD